MATSTHSRPVVAAPSTRRWGLTAAAVSLAVLLAALTLGGGSAEAVPGLPDPGGLTRWGLPVAKVMLDGASAVTVGMLALAVMLPSRRGEMGRDGLLAMRTAAIALRVGRFRDSIHSTRSGFSASRWPCSR